jgi:hypothetical protein
MGLTVLSADTVVIVLSGLVDEETSMRLGDRLRPGCPARALEIEVTESLLLDVLADGVETAAQAAWLRREGCDWAQGWHCGRAVPAEDFAVITHEVAPTASIWGALAAV